jgi:hypothetical protein
MVRERGETNHNQTEKAAGAQRLFMCVGFFREIQI